MKKFALPIISLLSIGIAVATFYSAPADNTEQKEWLRVLSLKREWLEARLTHPARAAGKKQAWADALGTFNRRYPGHTRAESAQQQLILEFADSLLQEGRYSEAALYYRSILDRDPARAEAREGLDRVKERSAISRSKLSALRPGMDQQEVAVALGKPADDWVRRLSSGKKPVEAWFYPGEGGGLAAVYFADGQLFTTSFDAAVASPVGSEAAAAGRS